MGLHLENEVYCVRQVVNTLTIILNDPVYSRCTCNVTLRRVRVTIFAVEEQ